MKKVASSILRNRSVLLNNTKNILNAKPQQRNIAILQRNKFANIQTCEKQAAGVKRFYSVKPFALPPLGAESITKADISEWLKKEGDYVREGEVICKATTEKSEVEIVCSLSGQIKSITKKLNDVVEQGEQICTIDTSVVPPKEEAKPIPQKAAPKVEAAPAPKAEKKAEPVAAPKPVVPAAPAPLMGSRTERRVPISLAKKAVIQKLKESQNANAILTTFNEIDISRTLEICKKSKQLYEKQGIEFTPVAAFVKAAAVALKEIPNVNNIIDGEDIVTRNYYDINVPITIPKTETVVSPLIRSVNEKSIFALEKEIRSLADKAAKKQLLPADLQSGTFAITNFGPGSLMGQNILNSMNSGMLNIHDIKKRVVSVDDKAVIRPMMFVSFTYDHRIIDGKEAVTFLKRVKELIEDPDQFLLIQ